MARTDRRGGRRARRAVVVAAAAWLAGCVVSPVPQPPPLGVEVDGTQIVADGCPTCDVQLVEVRGPAGAVVGEGAELWIVNLDNQLRPGLYPVNDDGSFAVLVDGTPADELRLQARRGDERSAPVDVVAGADWLAEPVEHRYGACLSLEPALEAEVDPSGPRTIALQNDCADALEIEARLRTPTSTFVVTESPSRLEAGEAGAVTLRSEGGSPEEILFVEVTAPVRDRRAVTVIEAEPGD